MGTLWVLGLWLAAGGAGRVEGTLVDLQGRHAAGCGLTIGREVLPFAFDQPRTTDTDARGHFALGDLPAGRYRLRWPRAIPFGCWQRDLEVAAGQTLRCDLLTDVPALPEPPLARLRLRVSLADGRPAARQPFTLRARSVGAPRASGGGEFGSVPTFFDFKDSGRGGPRLHDQERVWHEQVGADGTWSVEAPPGQLDVSLWLPVRGGGLQRVETRFLTPGDAWELSAEVPAVAADEQPAPRRASPTTKAPARARAGVDHGPVDASQKDIRARVLGPDGRPWARREVWLFCNGYNAPGTAHATTDADGCVVRHAPWSSSLHNAELHLKVAGFAAVSETVAEPRGRLARVTLRLGPPAARAAGVVVDRLGQPVPHCWVLAAAEPLHYFSVCEPVTEQRVLAAFVRAEWPWSPHPGELALPGQLAEGLYCTRSDAAGRYWFDQLDRGHCSFIALPVGLAPVRVAGVTLGAAAAQVPKLVLPPASTLAARVTDPAGRPLARVPVIVDLETEAKSAPARSEAWLVTTDDQGQVPPQPLAGQTRLLLGLPGGAEPSWVGLFPSPGQTRSVVHASPPPRPLTGVVRGPDGQPLANALVTVDNDGSGRNVWTGADGGFRFDWLCGGEATVRVRAGGCALLEQELALPRAEPLELRVNRGVPLRLRVVDEAGQPLEDADVDWRVAGGRRRDENQWQQASTFGNGLLASEAVPLAGCAFSVEANGCRRRLVTVAPTAGGAPVEVKLRRERSGQLVVRLLSADGRPVPGQAYAMSAIDGDSSVPTHPGENFAAGAEAGEAADATELGIARIRTLTGRAAVSARYGPLQAAPVIVDVPEQGEARCDVRFTDYRVTGAVRGADEVNFEPCEAAPAGPHPPVAMMPEFTARSVVDGQCDVALAQGRYRVSGWTDADEAQPPWVRYHVPLGELAVPCKLFALTAVPPTGPGSLLLHWAELPSVENLARECVLTDAAGERLVARFEFGRNGLLNLTGLAPGRYLLARSNSEAGGVAELVEVAPDGPTRLELRPIAPPNVRGRVQGAPPGAFVLAIHARGAAGSFPAPGEPFALTLPPGPCELTCWHPADERARRWERLTTQVTVGAEPLELNLNWEARQR